MRGLLRTIDELLRGGFTSKETLRSGEVPLSPRQALTAVLLLGAIYGAFMGLYGVLRSSNQSLGQMFADMAKVPLLFVLTLGVTLPSLYVVSALAGSRLRFGHTLRLLLAAVVVNMALLASFGPVTGFFTVSTESYAFMVLLNVLFFGVSGLVGLAFLRRAVDAVFDGEAGSAPLPESPVTGIESGENSVLSPPPPPVPRRASTPPAKRVFMIWTVIYGAVGAQMGWVMRPFIGSPGMAFTLFRERESNFFEAVMLKIGELFS